MTLYCVRHSAVTAAEREALHGGVGSAFIWLTAMIKINSKLHSWTFTVYCNCVVLFSAHHIRKRCFCNHWHFHLILDVFRGSCNADRPSFGPLLILLPLSWWESQELFFQVWSVALCRYNLEIYPLWGHCLIWARVEPYLIQSMKRARDSWFLQI